MQCNVTATRNGTQAIHPEWANGRVAQALHGSRLHYLPHHDCLTLNTLARSGSVAVLNTDLICIRDAFRGWICQLKR